MGLSFFLFLLVFEPFQIRPDISWSGHGIVFRSALFGFWAFWVFFTLEKQGYSIWWTRAGELLALVLLSFFSLNYFWGGRDWTLSVFIEMSWQVTLLALFLLGLYYLIRLVVHGRNEREGVDSDAFLRIVAENGKDQIDMRLADFIMAKSDGNYLDLHQVSESNYQKSDSKIFEGLGKRFDGLSHYYAIYPQ